MVSPEGRGHAPHTQTPEQLMAPPCFGKTAGTGAAGSVEKRGAKTGERERFRKTLEIGNLRFMFPLQ